MVSISQFGFFYCHSSTLYYRDGGMLHCYCVACNPPATVWIVCIHLIHVDIQCCEQRKRVGRCHKHPPHSAPLCAAPHLDFQESAAKYRLLAGGLCRTVEDCMHFSELCNLNHIYIWYFIQHTPILKIRLQNFLLWIWHELPSARCRGVSLQTKRLYTREVVARLATAMCHYAGSLSCDCRALGSFSMPIMRCVHFHHLNFFTGLQVCLSCVKHFWCGEQRMATNLNKYVFVLVSARGRPETN